MSRLVCGIGVNDADYVVQKFKYLGCGTEGRVKYKRTWVCPFYRQWANMLQRCYSDKCKDKYPTYNNVVCCKEWLTFSKFKQWMEKQDWEGKHLDKDIVYPSSKVYSPETCAFVLPITNNFVIASDASRGQYPLGVCWHKNKEKFKAQCRNPFTGKVEHLGYFLTPEEAHEAWCKRKHELAQLAAAAESDPRVVESLKKRYSSEEWCKHNQAGGK